MMNDDRAGASPVEHEVRRLQRRLQKRDRRIAGLTRRVAELESRLSTQSLDMQRLPRDVTRAVQEALCNVRMIPVLGLGGHRKIVEVKTSDA